MIPHVLGIGYSYDEYSVTAAWWEKYGIEFDYANDIRQAAAMMSFKTYICVSICTDVIPQEDLDLLRQIKPIPIVVVPPSYSEEQRDVCVHFGIAQYLHMYKFPATDVILPQESIHSYLEIPSDKQKPLTIITAKELSFCLEYRTVEINGKSVELTEKEFDILALLIMNQRQVFTHGMIMDAVWHDDISFYSPKALTTHISNLRRKLQIGPGVPEYIQSVRGVGYKFVVPE